MILSAHDSFRRMALLAIDRFGQVRADRAKEYITVELRDRFVCFRSELIRAQVRPESLDSEEIQNVL